ncbi:hypothetical protein IQ231_17735, partial [Cuspidothrix issatschenkoi LEGE 03284]|uniref:hypothetical protein n=1 Tax=Cuspidothrix issatschenkoi TaxID=230752 RepID=UPI0019D984AE
MGFTSVITNGKIVVNSDEWALSNVGFQQSPDAAKFAINVAKYFVGEGKGKFHALSNNFGLVESSLEQTMTQAGHTWTKGTNITIDLPTLSKYDGIFVAGDVVDNQVLIQYVKNGGKVYLAAGTDPKGTPEAAQAEADGWNKFLGEFGLKFVGTYNGIGGNLSPNQSHPLFTGVKSLHFNNGNSITDLKPESPLNEIIHTHNGQGVIATAEFERIVPLAVTVSNTNGKIVVNSDEWTLSDAGFQRSPDAAKFAINVAKYFVGEGKGKFHALSNNFGLVQSSLEQTMTQAGHTWTKGTNITIDLPTLSKYDGIFLAGDVVDNQVLIQYVKNGGKVYLAAGTGAGGPQQEADSWNKFLGEFGLKFAATYNGVGGNLSPNQSHPLFVGVKSLYFHSGNSITDLKPESPLNEIIHTHDGEGVIATAEFERIVPLAVTVSNTNGKIVVNSDEWTLSDAGFQRSPDAAKFAINVAKYFVGEGKGKFHVLSNNFGLVQSSLEQTMTQAGHTWTKGTNITIDLPTLSKYDGIFLAGDVVDNQVLIQYVKNGGKVYLAAGTGAGGPQQEADSWNKFLGEFGLKFAATYNGVGGNLSPNQSHPLFVGVKSLYFHSGNSITDLKPESPLNEIIHTHNGEGVIATAEFARTAPLATASTSEPATPTKQILSEKWAQVPNSGAVIGVTVMKDGTILGIG